MELSDLVCQLRAQLARRDQEYAVLKAQYVAQKEQNAKLAEQVAMLLEKLGANSSNSNKPPSSDSPGSGSSTNKNREKRGRKGKKRGGQPGHKGTHRELLSPDQVDEFVDFFPPQCESCWTPLAQIEDAKASRFQVTEVPPIKPHVTEYRCHSVTCDCGHATRAGCDEVPTSAFGPRLTSLAGLLTGVYHVSRRKTVTLLSDMLGVRISLGAVSALEQRVSEAVIPAVDEIWEKIPDAPVKHADGTSWLEAGKTMSLWTIATAAVTVFRILQSGSKKNLQALFTKMCGILVSDRDSSLTFWAMENRQICWAHLLRKFISFSERDGPAGELGREFLDYTRLIFEYWHAHSAGQIDRRTYLEYMAPVREGFEDLLGRARDAGIKRLSGSCDNLWAHKDALWTFVDTRGVPPTNNHAERELRSFVLWRKRSFGAQSERGHLFAERIMTVAHTARKQDRDILSFLTSCCQARDLGLPTPSLFAAETS